MRSSVTKRFIAVLLASCLAMPMGCLAMSTGSAPGDQAQPAPPTADRQNDQAGPKQKKKQAQKGKNIAKKKGKARPRKSKSKPVKTVKQQHQAGRLYFEVIEVTLNKQQLNDRPIRGLVREALKDGQRKTKYVFDVPICIGEETSLVAENRVPNYVCTPGAKERRRNTGYEESGCVVELWTRWVDDGGTHKIVANWQVELRELTQSGKVKPAKGQDALSVTETHQEFSSVFAPPGDTNECYMLSNPATNKDPSDEAKVYVYRYSLHLDQQ